MRKIYGCLLVLLLGPAVLFVCICIFSNISFSECSKTWFCKDINMYVTIVHKHSGDDMIVLNNTDTIFTLDNLGASLGGVELHFKEHNDTVYIPNSHLSISKIKAHKYKVIIVDDNRVREFRVPTLVKHDDITICGDIDSWNFYVFKNGKAWNGLEVVN